MLQRQCVTYTDVSVYCAVYFVVFFYIDSVSLVWLCLYSLFLFTSSIFEFEFLFWCCACCLCGGSGRCLLASLRIDKWITTFVGHFFSLDPLNIAGAFHHYFHWRYPRSHFVLALRISCHEEVCIFSGTAPSCVHARHKHNNSVYAPSWQSCFYLEPLFWKAIFLCLGGWTTAPSPDRIPTI